MKVKNQGGWLAVEAMAAVLVMLMSVPIFYSLWAFAKAGEEQAVAAGQLKTVADGFESYVLDNHTSLIATATATTATSITFATMKTAGHVRAGVSATNIWGQGYVAYVLEPKAGTLEIIILTTGGSRTDVDFRNQVVPGTAVKIGSKGGYVPSGLLTGQPTTLMQGSYNGWQKSFTGTNIPNPGAGHLVHYSTTDDAAAGQDFLYRKAVPGNPDLNKMETDLNMGSNDISAITRLTMTSAGVVDMTNGTLTNTGLVNMTANTGVVDLNNGSIIDVKSQTMKAGGTLNMSNGPISAVTRMTMTSAGVVDMTNGTLTNTALVNMTATTGVVDMNSGTIREVKSQVMSAGGTLNMNNGPISAVSSQTMTAGGTLDMNSGPITKASSLKLNQNGTVGQWCPDTSEGIVIYNDSQGLLVCRQNAYHIVADTGNSSTVKDVEQVWNGGVYAKPTCPAGTGMVPRIFVSPSFISGQNLAKPMHAIQAWAVDQGTSWLIQMRVLIDTGWVSPNANYGRGIAIMTCEKN